MGQLMRGLEGVRVAIERVGDILERIAGREGEGPAGEAKGKKRMVESESDGGEDSAGDTEMEADGIAEENFGDNGDGGKDMGMEVYTPSSTSSW